MRTATVKIRGISPYSQSKHYSTTTHPKEGQEGPGAYEARTWRARMHTNKDGRVVIPAMAFKNGLVTAAKFLGLKIPGKGNKTYTKRFESGVMCVESITLDVLAADVVGEELFVPSDGIRGGGKRVLKTFGRIDEWGGTVSVIVLDELIQCKAFEEHMTAFGQFIGLGRFRPERNGFYGRFVVEKVVWS